MLTFIGLTLIIGWLFGERTVGGLFIMLALFLLICIPYYWATVGFSLGVFAVYIIGACLSFTIGGTIMGKQ